MGQEGGVPMYNRRPLLTIVKAIERKIKERDYSIRSLEQELDKKGYDKITRGKIFRTFYTKDGRQFFLNSADDTIEAVLDVLGMTAEDVMRDILQREENEYPEDVKEIFKFARKPEALPYLRLAYAQYKAREAELEVERIKEELSKSSPK